jgi:hypothetical protein
MHSDGNYRSRCSEPEHTMFLYVVAMLCEVDGGHTKYFGK